MMQADKIQRYGDELYAALTTRETVAPLTSREPDITIEDAYHIQQRMISRRLDAGERIVGKKIGVTSKVVQNMLNVHQPDFGYLLDGMIYNEGESIAANSLIITLINGIFNSSHPWVTFRPLDARTFAAWAYPAEGAISGPSFCSSALFPFTASSYTRIELR